MPCAAAILTKKHGAAIARVNAAVSVLAKILLLTVVQSTLIAVVYHRQHHNMARPVNAKVSPAEATVTV